jgi:hypothetical protein
MTKEARITNDEEAQSACGLVRGFSSFGLRHSFVIWISSFVIASSAAADQPVDYLREIKPIFTQRCFPCHGAIKQQAKLRLDTVASMIRGGNSGAVIVPGQPGESLLVDAITGAAGFRMPPETEGKPLSADEIAKIKRWIAEGAKHPDDEQPAVDPKNYWSYLPVKRPPVPPRPGTRRGVGGEGRATPDANRKPNPETPGPLTPALSPKGERVNPIDVFISAEHAKRGLTASSPADPATLLRRVYFDLIGLPPTREELRAFLADPSDAAYEQVVDKLLASPQYGERWGRHWMDVWRYSDWYGSRGINEIRYSQRHIWRWRDWIVESLNADKGYDRMVVEMLAGDELAPGDGGTVRATGFLGRNWYKFDRNVWMFETVEQTAQAFLGLTLKCARCHDHKYDPIAQRDYYRFRAFFEPHDVRTDPFSGNLATEKDATLGPVLREGVSLVFDKQLDAPTYLFARGDNRNPVKDEPLTPAVPTAFGYDIGEIQPITLPTEAVSPYVKPAVVDGLLDSARSVVKSAKDAVANANAAVTVAEKKLADFVAAESSGSAPAVGPTGTVFADRFEKPRPDVWKVAGGQWDYENGRVVQKQPGTFPTLVASVKHPADFVARLKYKTLPDGTIGSVGFFFDVVDLRDCQAVYTATSAGSVQAFHRQAGVEHYPPAGIFKAPVKVNDDVVLDIAACGQKLNVWVNGDLAIVYTMPLVRQAGTFAIWTHAATAEFSELLVDPLPAGFRLADAVSDKIRSPFAIPNRIDVERAVDASRRGVQLAEKKLASARADLDAVESRVAADRAKVGVPPSGDQPAEAGTPASVLATVAAKAERQVAVIRAEQELLEAELIFHAAEQAAHANDDAKKKSLANAAAKRAAATKALETAKANALKDDGNYTPLGPTYPATSTGRRLALARWLVDPRNPRTARIAVNHIWLRHFGQALVPSVANFGLNGDRPSHAELLDWLAAELMAPQSPPLAKGGPGEVDPQPWSMKHIHRLIVLSNAYRQTSRIADLRLPIADGSTTDPAGSSNRQSEIDNRQSLDPHNRFLWRMNSRRMESEVVRDSVLYLAGQLDLTPGGPEIPESEGQTSRRRSLFFRSTPNEKMQFLELFDQANPNECYRRQESVMPQQALALGNSALSLNQSRLLAKRLSDEVGSADEPLRVAAFIHAAFETILSRPPKPEEVAACAKFLQENKELIRSGSKTAFSPAAGPNVTAPAADPHLHARENLIHVLFSHNDFVTIR